MLRALIRFSLDHSPFVLLAAVLLVAFAAWRVPSMPIDVFPELQAPTVVILTESGGLAADEVELYVTFPIEAAMGGIDGVRRVRSSSTIGLSLVWVEFDWGTDVYRCRQLVSERLSSARESLPADAHSELAPVTSITGEIMLLSLSSPEGTTDPLDLRAFAEYELRNRLLAVQGIAQVSALGGALPEYQVHVRQEDLRLHGMTLEEVADAAASAHSTASAGYLTDVEDRELPIRQTARVRRAEDIAATIVRMGHGRPVTVGDVADVQLGPALARGTASESGRSAVVLTVQKSPGTNTLDLTERIDAELDRAASVLPEGAVLNRHVMRQADFIQRSIDNVLTALRDASIIVVVVLLLFLLDVRTAFITLTAIPLSLAAALLTLDALGLGINVMSLGGLAVAVGVLVDDAIIDVENVHRRLRESRSEGGARTEVVFEASNEIRPAMVFATVVIVMAFIPLFFLQGLEGRFFRPLGVTYVVSILASLLVALTVTPALCRYLLAGRAAAKRREEGWLVRFLKRLYGPTLEFVVRRGKLVLGASVVVTAAALWLGSTFGTSFLPKFNEGTFTIFLFAPPGTSLAESDRMASGVELQLTEIQGVRSVVRRTGRAERDEHAEPVSNSEIEVSVEPEAEMSAVRRHIDEVLAAVPGITTQVGQPIEHRLSHVLSGTPAAVAINVFGDDLDLLRELGAEIADVVRAIPGTRDVAASREVSTSSLVVDYRHEDLAAAGLSPASAAEQVRRAIYGDTVAQVADGVRRYDLVVRLDPAERERVEQVSDLMLRGEGGATVRLRDVADVGPERTPALITRENVRRKVVVSCNVAEGYNLGDLVDAVAERVDPIVNEHGCSVSYGGQFQARRDAAQTMLVAGLGVLVLMWMLLQVTTGSNRAALLVLTNLPLALPGGLIAIYLTEVRDPFGNTWALFGEGRYEAPVVSIASLVGFITLFGIAIRNGILLVNHYRNLMDQGHGVREAVVQGSMERLVPILMTAVSAALGLVPLALAGGSPGSELLAPLAVVVLGGLSTSTALNLVVVPAGYALVFRRDEPA